MPTQNGKRVLLAEDSAVTQDIIKLILGQRGHEVEIAHDGQEAYDMLLAREFDVALMDFHLPAMSGLEATKRFLAERSGKPVPRMIALTGDAQGLLEADEKARHFDLVISKPFKIDDIIPIIEAEESRPKLFNSNAENAVNAAEMQMAEIAMPFEDSNLYLIYYPRDFHSSYRNAVSMRLANEGTPDAIVITQMPSEAQIETIANLRRAHSAPIIDLTGGLGIRADLSVEGAPTLAQLRTVVEQFDDRKRGLHPDLEQPENIDEILLLRAYLKGGKLYPEYSHKAKRGVIYNTLHDSEAVVESAERLEENGMLAGQFFDRLVHCPECSSARMLPREICPECGSTDLREEFYLHHYRCAWQGPESAFKSGDDLICPKCRYELTHFGKDYDKPGSMMVCNSCGNGTTDPDVSFRCLDSGDEVSGERVVSKIYKSYQLTERAEEFLEAGRIVLGDIRRSFRFSDLPIELIVELNGFARNYLESKTPFALASIGYKNLRALEREKGVRACDQAREMLASIARESVVGVSKSASGVAYDYIIVGNMTKEMLEQQLQTGVATALRQINLPLDAIVTVFGPEDLRT